MQTLDEIGLRHGTDKASDKHDFLDLYERRLGHLRNAGNFLLIEIGVLQGQSLETWSEYFPSAQIVGIDINPDCKRFAGGNKTIAIGDQSDPDFLLGIVKGFGRPSVVIDDGSHVWPHQITTLRTLFPHLLPSGIFIIEDIDTSFAGYSWAGSDYSGGSATTAFDYLSCLARRVVGIGHASHEPADHFCRTAAPLIKSIELAPQTALIYRRDSA